MAAPNRKIKSTQSQRNIRQPVNQIHLKFKRIIGLYHIFVLIIFDLNLPKSGNNFFKLYADTIDSSNCIYKLKLWDGSVSFVQLSIATE